MPHDYSIKQKAFYSGGRKVSRSAVRKEINGLTEYVSRQSARLAGQLRRGAISNIEFELSMRELLKSAHIVAASVGRGGRALMTQSDWGRVGSKIRWQYGYLSKFARRIKAGGISEAATVSRARSYASSIFVSFSRTFQKAQEIFVEGGKNPERCRLVTNCGDFCKCDIIFEDDETLPDFKIKLSVEA
jgi:hypothetical protein